MRLFFIFFILGLGLSNTEAQGLDKSMFTINGLDLFSPKDSVLKVLGQPEKISFPDYECGFLSSFMEPEKTESLHFKNLVFSGKGQEKFVAEFIPLNEDWDIRYGDKEVHCELSFECLTEIFGEEIIWQFHESYDGFLVVRFDNADDGLSFHWSKGKLIKLVYWSPC